MKEGLVRKNAAAPDMEQIGRYTRRAYSPEEVYTFSLVLCDNEVDRDFERFSREALEGLRELFLGKTVLLDHQRSAASQTARIYDTGLEELPDKPGGRALCAPDRQGISAPHGEEPPGHRADRERHSEGGERGLLYEALGVLPVREGTVPACKGPHLWRAPVPPGAV